MGRKKKEIKEGLGKKIRHRRQVMEITAKELAERCGVQKRSVSAWEKKGQVPSGELLLKVCVILGMKIEDFEDFSKE